MKQVKALLIGAGSRGAKAYAPYALRYPEKIKFIAVAEPIKSRREEFCRQHGIGAEYAFESYEQMLEKQIPADVVFICTQDSLHKQPALMALDAGYDVVLEKPISTLLDDCEEIVAKAKHKGLELVICHVLQYTRFFQSLKNIIESGEIGEVVSINLTENVGYWHAAHSYVRGNWRNEAESCPMLLAKSCHDADILQWLVASPCTKVSSFGQRGFFTGQHAPEGSTLRCLDGCKAKEQCPFDAEKIYMNPAITAWPVNVITDDLSPEGRLAALKEGPYGRCVFHCDNDVVDRQVMIAEYASGAVTNFTMSSLSSRMCRDITVCATKGQIWGTMEEAVLYKSVFGREIEKICTRKPEDSEYGHGGGDDGLMDYVCELFSTVKSERKNNGSDAIIGHRICFAAEKSRRENTVVCL